MEEDLSHDAQTRNVPRRGRWYTRLWPSCLGCRCTRHHRRNKYPLYLIGYDPTGPLQRAASVGDLDTAEKLIHSSQHHVDESDRRSRTSLHYACAHNHPDVVLLLLENNSNINIRDDEDCTPLIKAAQRDNIHCVSVLLDYKADLNVIDFSGHTAFHHAVSRGNLPIVKLLMKHKVDIEAKTEYGLTPLQLAAYEQNPEMVKFLEAMCANAHAPAEINGTETPAHKTGVKHVSFNEVSEVCYFEEERPLSRKKNKVRPQGQLNSILKCSSQYNTVSEVFYFEEERPSSWKRNKVRPQGELNSILKYSSQYNTASDQTTRTSLWCMKGDNVRYTSGNKEESSKTFQRLRKRMRKVFRKSEVYVCSQEESIHDSFAEKASVMDEGSKSENFHHVPQEHRISEPEAPADVEPMPSTSAADTGATMDIEPTPSTSAADSELCGRRGFSITPRENVEFSEWLNREILPLNMEIEGTSSQSAAVSGATADMEPIPSTSAASSRAAADTEITLYQYAADSVAIADTEPIFFIAESDESDDSETDSDTELDLISYLADYMEHARDMPCSDPESTPGLRTCHSIDCTDRDELNIFSLFRTEDKFDSFSLDEEPTPVPDLDEDLASTQDAEVFYDALVSADHAGNSRSTDRVPGFLLHPEMLLMLLWPFLWLFTQLLSIMAGLRNHIQQVWHEEHVEGPPTIKKGSDSISLETSILKETTSENNINQIGLHLLTVSQYFDPNDNDTDATDADADNTTMLFPMILLMLFAFLLVASVADP